MKHRISNVTGFGANAEVLLDNKGEINKDFADDAINKFFAEWEGFDFTAQNNIVSVGIEPTYQYDKLRIVTINKDKNHSTYTTGKSFGPYGSQVVSRTKIYSEYKRKSKFIKFVDKWHSILFQEKK